MCLHLDRSKEKKGLLYIIIIQAGNGVCTFVIDIRRNKMELGVVVVF